MKEIRHTIDEYKALSGDVWMIFKKYFDTSADSDEFTTKDISDLTKKYSYNPRIYDFTCRLMKLYFDELVELKELRRNGERS